MTSKLIVAGAAVALSAMLVVGGTLAYFTATDDAKNTFTVGDVDITLTEDAWTETGSSQADNVVPGREIAKDPTVVAAQGSQPSYVRLVVQVPEALDDFIKFGDLSTGWSQVGTAATAEGIVSYVFEYADAIADEASTTALFHTVTISPEATGEDLADFAAGFDINVLAYAVQAEGFTSAAEAFTTAFSGIFSA